MIIQTTTIYLDHFLTPHQIVMHNLLERHFSITFDRNIVLRETTAKWPLSDEELISRLIEPDCIIFSSVDDFPLEIWVTKSALAIDFLTEKYSWSNILQKESSFNCFRSISGKLVREFNSRHAVIAPRYGQGGGEALELFVEGICTDELIDRLLLVAGLPLGVLTDASLAMQFTPIDLENGYFIFENKNLDIDKHLNP